MDFYELVTQVLALLQRHKRVSYRALKRQFGIDDAYLEDLKEEFLYAHATTVEADDRGFVWTGDVEGTIDTPAPLPQSILAPLTQETASIQLTSPLGTSRTPEAERRQLTVMFIDIVESTSLSTQLDPEDLREVIQAYQRVCAEVVNRFDGHIAQLLGDGLLVYFGYPQAHEDDAHRAVRTGLGILAAMGDLCTRLKQDKGLQLAVRVGIHTGLVVVGAMGGGARQEQLALGETPNVAARIEGLAQPNTVAISDATSRLVQGYFECQDLGAQTLRGVAEPVHVYRVLQESGAQSRLDIVSVRGFTPLVGREQEVRSLLERWGQVKDGQGQVVVLSGEGGIGKSRLVQILKDHVASEPHTRWECRSSSYYQNTALYPLTELFQRLLQWQLDETPEEKFSKLEQTLRPYRLPVEESVPLFAPLLSLSLPAHHYPPLNLSPQRQRQKTLETIVAILLELAEHQPVLFIVEDLHWTDPTTLELLNLVIDQTPTASVLVLLTCRPTFQPSWSHRSYLTELTVNHLSQPQIERMTTHVAGGKPLPKEVCIQIADKTDGVPLFVEEITKAVLESGALQDSHGQYTLTGPLASFAIPATLQDSLMARRDRLVTAKAIAQYAAVIGRQFAYDLLSTVSQLDEVTLQRELGRLVEAEIVYQRGVPPQATYTFKHALIQDAAYQSLLKSTRQQYHQRIGQVLEAQFPETAETQSELVAHHYTEAGITAKAVSYWHKAGQRARANFAYVETIAHITKGLQLLETLPETPARLHNELDMQLMLGAALMATKGYGAPEVEQVYTRAHVLCQHESAAPRLADVLYGLRRVYTHRGEFRKACDIAGQSLRLAHRAHDDAAALELRHVFPCHTGRSVWQTWTGGSRHASLGRSVRVGGHQ